MSRIPLGANVGCTGASLISSALHELERTDAIWPSSPCVAVGLGTGTIIERL